MSPRALVLLASTALLPFVADCGPRTRPDAGVPPIYELGVLPTDLRSVQWPQPPRTDRDDDIAHSEPGMHRVNESGARWHVRSNLRQLVIAADDVEIQLEKNVFVDELFIERGHKRIKISGGRVGRIELSIPGRYDPTEEWRSEWMIEDVLIDRVHVLSPSGPGITLRGRRLAVVRSRVGARHSAVSVGDTNDLRSEDLIFAGNVFESDGEAATVNLSMVSRSIMVNCWTRNLRLHNYAVADSELTFASRNILAGGGAIVLPPRRGPIQTLWFVGNYLHHTTEGLFAFSGGSIDTAYLVSNWLYSNRTHCFLCDPPGPNWNVAGNTVRPYQDPPPPPDVPGGE